MLSFMRPLLQTVLSIMLVVTYGATGTLLGLIHHHHEVVRAEKHIPITIPVGGTHGSTPLPCEATPCTLCFAATQLVSTDPPRLSDAVPVLGCIESFLPLCAEAAFQTNLFHFGQRAPPAI
jgi:hypothetical protein